MILVKWPTCRTILFYVFIYVFNSLHVSSTSCSSSRERNCVNTTSGSCHSVSVAVSCAGRKWILFYVGYFYVFIYIFNSLHVPSTSCSSSGERNCINTTSGSCHSMSVAVSCAGRKWILFYVGYFYVFIYIFNSLNFSSTMCSKSIES